MRAWLHGPLFLGVFGACALGLGAWLERTDVPLEEAGTVSIKADHYRAHADEIDVVFVGSSRVYRQLSVPVFERELAARELPWTAYNLGLPGMRFLEALATAEDVLRRDADRLKWIVFELQDPEPGRHEARRFTWRNVRWHSPRRTALAAGRVLASDRPWDAKLTEAAAHLGQGLMRFANAGTGTRAVRELLGWRAPVPDGTPGGFLPLESEARKADIRERRDEFLHAFSLDPDFLSRERRLVALAPPLVPPAWLVDELERLVARAAAHGVGVVFLLSPPADHLWLALSRLQDEPRLPRVFAYDPERFPQLYYEPALRYDERHLNLEGAKQFTTLFARQFARHVKRRDG